MINTHRKISTVVAADVVGYSRLMGFDEEGALAALKFLRELFTGTVTEFGGAEFGSVGDSLMADFPSAVNALNFAVEMQRRVAAENEDIAPERRMNIRLGLNLGDVIVEDGSLFGDGVNVAARLQALAPPGGVIVSGSVFDQVEGKVEASFLFQGEQAVKNIASPVRTYLVADAGAPRSLAQVFSELGRRRIFRSAVAYVVAAWVIIQVADVVLPVFDAPDIVMRSLVTLLIIGFPLAIVLTWSFNLGAGGVIATPESGFSSRAGRWLQFLVVGSAASLSAIVLWTVWNGYLSKPVEEKTTSSERRVPVRIEQPAIAVLPFEKTLGGDDIDWLGDGVANLVRHALADSRQTLVYSAAASEDLAANQAGNDVDYLVSGSYLSTPAGEIVLSVEIAGADGSMLASEQVRASDSQDLIERVDSLNRRLFQHLKPALRKNRSASTRPTSRATT